MREEIRISLIESSDKEYRDFSKGLIPGEETLLGVRLPVLRKKAKKLAKGNWREELETEDIYFEEVMLRGMMLSYVKEDLETMLPYIEDYIPRVHNWSVCDSVFSKMEVFRTDGERTFAFIQPYLNSNKEFEVRTAIIIMMQHVLKCDERGKSIKRLSSVSYEDCMKDTGSAAGRVNKVLNALNREFPAYYASMAAAWTIAEAFCIEPGTVYRFLKEDRLDDATHNRALQKLGESLIPESRVKDEIRKMKRKKE